MTHSFYKLVPSLLIAASVVTGCAEPEAGPEYVQVDPPTTAFPQSSDEPEAVACEPADLCTRTIDECGTYFDPAQCEGWYADDANCDDMDGYLACNCECLTEAVCDDYFTCGEICFEDFCEAS